MLLGMLGSGDGNVEEHRARNMCIAVCACVHVCVWCVDTSQTKDHWTLGAHSPVKTNASGSQHIRNRGRIPSPDPALLMSSLPSGLVHL